MMMKSLSSVVLQNAQMSLKSDESRCKDGDSWYFSSGGETERGQLTFLL